MNTILYMAVSANGYIATATDETPWSDESWRAFAEKVSETGNIIIGARTYAIMIEGNEFERIGHPFVVVVSSSMNEPLQHGVIAKNPREALSLLEERGYSTALVAGGGQLNASFMEEGLIQELYLDIEPHLFGSGIPLFAHGEFKEKLELIESNSLSNDIVQLHYTVLR